MREHAVPSMTLEAPTRFSTIKNELISSPVMLCTERAELITEFFRKHDNKKETMVIRKARALRYLLQNKSVNIFKDELIVGNVGSKRKSAIMQPELAGVFMCEELLWIDRRKTNPYQVPWSERKRLLTKVIPYWLTRNMVLRAFRGRLIHLANYVVEQLRATKYLINEAGGIGHFLPNYEKILRLGIKGYLELMAENDTVLSEAAKIACEGVASYAGNLASQAESLAMNEADPTRAAELSEIARICRKVPYEPADTFHEALQSLWITHMCVCLEGLNSAVSLGRIDQYLYPYYKRDIEAGRISRDQALELALCFSAKTTEHVFLLSERTSQYHGGYLVAQAATVGGMDTEGRDAVNDLTYLFLDVMELAGLRDPNYMARIHKGSPREYILRAVDVARKGNAVPGLFNDEPTIASLTAHGHPLKEARDYGVVGCVEPSLPGKSFFSTDAALFNLPLCLILALNQGRRLNSRRRTGAATMKPEAITSMDQVMAAFRSQVDHMVESLIADLQVIEKGNRDYHPTPFSSMLVDGCLETGRDVTAGGAQYNSSGIQGVGIADVADSLAALDELVFRQKKYTIPRILDALRCDFDDAPILLAELKNAAKFGNDNIVPDRYADTVAHIFHDALARYRNTRGGPYVPGFYSSTCHVGFGNRTEALPSGRRSGEPFAASLGSCNGFDCEGPTALLNSVARIDSTLAANGYALNLRFDPRTLAGDKGLKVMAALTEGFFASGGMEVQLNVLDAEMLVDARAHPGKYPGIVVRVAGYCAYFDELPDTVKGEIISRTRIELQ
ncbi:MAG: formate acetyltransferase [Deltaproteobacteria bacterium]|nr:formate acetyltransferase [Deltaproteobacteria bacterium]